MMMEQLRAMCGPLAPGARCRPGQGRLDGHEKEAVDTGRSRLVFAGTVFLVAFMGVGVRLLDLALIDAATARRHAADQRVGVAPRAETRADIVDRNGAVLATSIVSYSVFADPKRVVGVERTARGLKAVFPELDLADLREKLAQKRRFVWIRRRAAPSAYQRILRMGLAGIGARKEERRIYPYGSLTAHIVGFANVDGKGLSGIEQHYDRRLSTDGEPLRLSIDVRAQSIVRRALSEAIGTYKAIGGAALMLDVKSGEIVSMVSLPDFDPHAPARAKENERFNRNTLGVYEMGSTFKIFNTAMALDYGVVGLNDRYDVRKPLKISRFTISDFHPERGPLTVAQVFVKSSNIGSAKIALDVGGKRQKAFLKRLGMLSRVPLELGETGKPLYPSNWRPINTMTVSFGHGVAVTPLHMAKAVASIANDGIMVSPTLVAGNERASAEGRRVVTPGTSRVILDLMRAVVEKGTGKRADAPGYRVGGKTGTAEKAGKRGYRRKRLLSSFIAVFPVDAPRYVVLASLDEPKGTKETYGYATGGWVAAPVVREIVSRTGPMFGVRPDAPKDDEAPSLMVAETAPAKVVYRRTSPPGRPRR